MEPFTDQNKNDMPFLRSHQQQSFESQSDPTQTSEVHISQVNTSEPIVNKENNVMSCNTSLNGLGSKKRSSNEVSQTSTGSTCFSESGEDKFGVRVLLCGDVCGRLRKLANCIDIVNKKHGPFDFVLCCGSFLEDSAAYGSETASFSFPHDTSTIAVNHDEHMFLSGQNNFNVPVYFIDCSHSYLGYALRSRYGSSFRFSPTLTYLGNFGFINLHGLNIGFISGLYSESYFFKNLVFDQTTENISLVQENMSHGLYKDENPLPCPNKHKNDIEESSDSFFPPSSYSGYDSPNQEVLQEFYGSYTVYYSSEAIKKFKASCSFYSGQCDIFISSEWPAGLDQTLSPEQKEQLQKLLDLTHPNSFSTSKISPVLSEIVECLEPRYHIASGRRIFYQRPPYKTSTHGFMSKFIGLGCVTSTADTPVTSQTCKFLHALLLQPLSQLNLILLRTQLPYSTMSPYSLYSVTQEEPNSTQPTSNNIQTVLENKVSQQNSGGTCLNRSLSEELPRTPLDNCSISSDVPDYTTQNGFPPHTKRYREEPQDVFFTNSSVKQRGSKLGKCVFVSNIPYEVDSKSFIEIMASFGEIVHVHMPRTPDGKSSGRAWITYNNEEDVVKAIQANEQLQSGGRLLKIQLSNIKSCNCYEDKGRVKAQSRFGEFEKRQQLNRNRLFGTGVGLTPQAIDVRPHTGCWFCLANPDCEKRLIISLGSKVYVALARGGIVPHHVLIIPVTHFPNYIFCPPNVSLEMEAYIHALRRCFKTQNQDIIVYERYFPMKMTTGMHMQLQVVPIPSAYSAASVQAFQKRAKRAGIQLLQFAQEESLQALGHYVKDSVVQPYLYVELPGVQPDTTVRWVYHTSSVEEKGALPFNFSREAIADLLEKPERSNWKSCVQEACIEDELVKDIQKLLAPFEPPT